MNIRNICIIAHVDHGKTTLVDFLLKQAGTFQSHENIQERVMDSDDQERERGITIFAKNASLKLGDTKVNIIDTPGHADFGGEVERIMNMADGAILLVDAAEGPLPQTRFVLQKAIEAKLKIMLCINKVDRPEVRNNQNISLCVDKVFDLFVELNASDEQMDFPIIYACARAGWCTGELDEIPAILSGEKKGGTLAPLFQEILKFPPPKILQQKEFSMLVSNIFYSDYLGTMALGKIRSGEVKANETITRYGVNASGKPITEKFYITKLLSYEGMKQVETQNVGAGDICLIAGCDAVVIGDTLGSEGVTPMPRIKVEDPTMKMIFSINSSPNSGSDGKAIQLRELKERLQKEVRNNVALRLEDGDYSDQLYLHGRGELQFSIIIEKLRREGLEFMVGRPVVLLKKDEQGQKLEPFEKLILELPETYAGEVTNMFQQRKAVLLSYEAIENEAETKRVKLAFEISTRGLLGTNSLFKTLTRGMGIMSSEMLGYKPFLGEISHRVNGSLVADRAGRTTAYALESIQERGVLFVNEGVDVYEGMIIGEHSRDNDLNVNPTKAKKLTNIRTTSSDGITQLQGTREMFLERCIEWINDDEWIEVTPLTIRIRKKVLSFSLRGLKKKED